MIYICTKTAVWRQHVVFLVQAVGMKPKTSEPSNKICCLWIHRIFTGLSCLVGQDCLATAPSVPRRNPKRTEVMMQMAFQVSVIELLHSMTLQNQVPWNCECGDAGVKRIPHLISLFFVWFEAGSFQFSFLTATPLASIRGSILRSLPHHQTYPSSHLSIRWVWMRLAKLLFMLPLFSPLFLLLVHQSITDPSLPRLFHSPFSSSLLHIALLLVFHFPSSVSSSSLPSSFSSSVSSHLFLISLVFSPVLSVICFPPFVLRPPPFPPHLLAWLYLLFLPPSLSLSQFLPVIPPSPSPPPSLAFFRWRRGHRRRVKRWWRRLVECAVQ